MKFYKRFFVIIMAIVTVANFCALGALRAFAHQETLDVSYDGCVFVDDDDENVEDDDGIDEMWYRLNIKYTVKRLALR